MAFRRIDKLMNRQNISIGLVVKNDELGLLDLLLA